MHPYLDPFDLQAAREGELMRRAYRAVRFTHTIPIRDQDLEQASGSLGEVTGPTRKAASPASPQNSDARTA